MFAMNMLHSPHKNSKQQSTIWKVSSDENIHGNMQVFCSEFCIFRYILQFWGEFKVQYSVYILAITQVTDDECMFNSRQFTKENSIDADF